MKKLIQLLKVWFKGALGLVLLLAILGILSLVAVSLSYLNYNPPIVPVCPVEEASTVIGAADSNGQVVNAVIREVSPSNRKIHVRLNGTGVVESEFGTNDWRPIIALKEIIPSETTGSPLAANLSIFDTIPEGKYQVSIIFVNNDAIPQTATCKLLITAQVTSQGTQYKVESRTQTPTQNEATQLVRRVVMGVIPGCIVLILVALAAGRFMRTFYDQPLMKGLRFLSHRIFGRPSAKKPVVLVTAEGGLFGDEFSQKVGGPALMVIRQDNAKAVVLEQGGKLTQVAYGSAYVQLEPFERIWDVLDLRPQRWVYKVKAITKDGIIVDYEAEVQFQIDIPDDPKVAKANIFKAATSKRIRDANRTEPDRVMTWDKQIVIGAMEGKLRGILALYDLDDLLEVGQRRAIRQQLQEALDKTAPDFGVKILDVALHNIEFNGKVLDQWFEKWQTERDAKVQEVLAKGRARRIEERERAKNQVRQELLSQTVKILKDMAQRHDLPLAQVSENYVRLSFIEMLRSAASERTPYMSDYMVRTLAHLQNLLASSPGASNSQSGTTPSQPGTPPPQLGSATPQNK